MNTLFATHRLLLTCVLLAVTAGTATAETTPKPSTQAQPEAPATPSAVPVAEPPPTDPIRRRIIEYEGKARGIDAGEQARSAESTKRLTARDTEVKELESQLAVALSLPPASPERTERIDQTFGALRMLVDRLRDDRSQAISALESAVNSRDNALAALIEPENGSPELREAIEHYRTALQGPVDAVQHEVDLASKHLTAARILRRNAQSHASPQAKQKARVDRFNEAASEIRSIPIDIQSSVRRTLGEWWKAPTKITQFQALGALFLGLLELAILLVMGMWIHGRIPLWTRRFLNHAEAKRENDQWSPSDRFPRWIVAGDLSALSGVAGPILQDLLVLMLSITIMMWLSSSIPIIAWLALIFAAGACIRLLQGAIELALITPSENRPALRVTEEAVRAGFLWAAQTYGLLFAIETILHHLLVDILAADSMAELIGDAAGFIAIAIAIIGLIRWGDTIRGRVRAGGSESLVAQWIKSAPQGGVFGIVSAAVSMVVLILRFIFNLMQGIIENRAGLSWLSAALARRQLREDPKVNRTPLALSTRNSIGQGALRNLHVEEYVQAILNRHQSWTADPRRGLVAITGDRGCGKSVVMDQLHHTMDGSVVARPVPIGSTTELRALQWLISITEIDAEPNTESIIEGLLNKPSTVFLLSNLHRLYIRSVGGYDGLDAVLAVMQATGRRHFWVASFHGPAWSFLRGMHHVGNVGVFQTQLQIEAMGPADLSAWLLTQTRAAGFTPRFEGMLQRPARGPDKLRVMERTERAYWRLLSDASMGNPTVAVRLWVDGLRANADPKILDVTVPQAHDSQALDQLEDLELFALTALILHDDMSVNELHNVLNMAEGSIRAVCRGLEQQTLITETDHNRYKVRLNWLPAVERHLRRRSFLHKS